MTTTVGSFRALDRIDSNFLLPQEVETSLDIFDARHWYEIVIVETLPPPITPTVGIGCDSVCKLIKELGRNTVFLTRFF